MRTIFNFAIIYLLLTIQSHSFTITPTDILKNNTAKNHLTHTVKKGEALSTIAEKYYYSTYSSVEMIKTVNGVSDKNKIFIDQKLIIPTSNHFLEKNGFKDVLNNTRLIAKRHKRTKDLFLGIYFCTEEHPEYKESCLNITKFIVIQFTESGKQKNIFDFSYLNEKYWPYASWQFVDLDGDGGVGVLGEWMQGSDNYTMHIAMHFNGEKYLECEVAGEIALGRFDLERDKTGATLFEYQHRSYTDDLYLHQESTVVKWSEIKNKCKTGNIK